MKAWFLIRNFFKKLIIVMVNVSKVETVRKALITQTVFLVVVIAVCGALSFATNKFLNIQVAKKGKIESSIKSMDRSIKNKSEAIILLRMK